MIIFRISTGEASISQKNTFPHHCIIIIMIVSYKHTHHITRFFHCRKHSRIQFRCTSFLHTSSAKNRIFGTGSFIVFRKRNMEKGKSRQRLSTILRFISCTLLAIPIYLIECKPCISLHIFQRRIGMRIHAIKQSCILLYIRRRFHG